MPYRGDHPRLGDGFIFFLNYFGGAADDLARTLADPDFRVFRFANIRAEALHTVIFTIATNRARAIYTTYDAQPPSTEQMRREAMQFDRADRRQQGTEIDDQRLTIVPDGTGWLLVDSAENRVRYHQIFDRAGEAPC